MRDMGELRAPWPMVHREESGTCDAVCTVGTGGAGYSCAPQSGKWIC